MPRSYVRPANVPGPREGRISDLILRQGEIAAGAVRQSGANEANAIRQRGAVEAEGHRRAGANTAQMASSIGGMVSSLAQGWAQHEAGAPKRELEGLQLTAAKESAAETATVRKAINEASGDLGKAIVSLEASGNAVAASSVRTLLAQRQASEQQSIIQGYEVKERLYGDANKLIAIVKADPAQYPQVAPQIAAVAEKLNPGWGKMVPPHYDPKALEALDNFSLTESQRAARIKALADAADAQRKGLVDQKGLDEWGQDYLSQFFSLLDPEQATPEDYQGALSYAKARGVSPAVMSLFGGDVKEAITRSEKLLGPKPTGELTFKEWLGKKATEIGRPNADAFSSKELLQFQQDFAKSKHVQSRSTAGDGDVGATALTDEAIDVLANQFAMTGTMPPLGAGKAAGATRARVINQAANLYSGLDLPSQIAAYTAAKTSLVKRSEQLSSLGAFEETAMANLERFIASAKKVVDTGSPWVNGYMREVQRNLLGDADLAAYETARRAVVPELARIITNPNLGGVLSDSARHETDTLLQSDYTFKQLVASAEMLVADAKQRKISLQDEIAALSKRLASPPKQRDAVAAPAPEAVSGVLKGQEPGEYELSDGSTWVVGTDGSIRKKG